LYGKIPAEGRIRMIIKSVELETVCGITSTLPENSCPEIAIAGKSNVGKSSLINGLMNRKSYARISSKPGKTQTINYYNINKEFYLVDLPGYGYATAGVEIKAQWGKLIEDYLHQSKKLKLVLLLIDSRHEPSENDIIMYDWICTHGYVPVIIATKADKLGVNESKTRRSQICAGLGVENEENVILYSALDQSGREEIYTRIASAAGVADESILEKKVPVKTRQIQEHAAAGKTKERWRKTGRPQKNGAKRK
jgi:GTP-binding protein